VKHLLEKGKAKREREKKTNAIVRRERREERRATKPEDEQE